MTAYARDGEGPLPPYLIDYDYLNPSPLFTQPQIDFIESIRTDFSEENIQRIRKLEWFRLNLNRGVVGCGTIPGLRLETGVGVAYVKRFSGGEEAEKMVESFLSSTPAGYPKEDVGNWHVRPYKITTPREDRYYPIAYHGDLEQWRRRLQESAARHHTLLGRFDRGKFVLSDGRSFPFSSLKIERAEGRTYPEDW